MAASVRKFVDCREFPSQNNCSLKISGTEDEVLQVAIQHAVASHAHENTPDLKEKLRSAMREEH